MLLLVERNLFRAGTRLFGKRFIALESAPTDRTEEREDFVEKNQDYDRLRSETDKSLRVAIIGLPNVGKSTLINRLINRPICATANRVHLTRSKADAIYSSDDTQLVFIDTPGLVSAHEFKKFNLEESFRSDAAEAMASADIVGVVQDASNKYTRGMIHDRILELMKMSRVGATSLLIMNKIDLMKRKKELLSLVRSLTSEKGWPNFSDVFMVSSLTNDGIDDLRNYLLDSAKNRDWEYPRNVVTNQPPERIIECSVRSKLMDSLQQEIPYQLKINMEHMNTCEDGSLSCFVIVACESRRISMIVMGRRGERIRLVARESEQELSTAFRTSVRLKISVRIEDKKDRPIGRN